MFFFPLFRQQHQIQMVRKRRIPPAVDPTMIRTCFVLSEHLRCATSFGIAHVSIYSKTKLRPREDTDAVLHISEHPLVFSRHFVSCENNKSWGGGGGCYLRLIFALSRAKTITHGCLKCVLEFIIQLSAVHYFLVTRSAVSCLSIF